MFKKTFILAISAMFMFSSFSYAEDFSSKKQLQQESVEGVFFSTMLPVINVLGGDREEVFENHKTVDLKSINTDNAITFNDLRVISIGSDVFSLAIYARGEMVSFDNNELQREAILNWNREGIISLKEAKKIADSFLRDKIIPFLELTDAEEIVPFHVLYSKYGEAEVDEIAQEKIVAYDIVYSRTINGVHVIGAGSKIRISVGTDGKILGYRYDWPKINNFKGVQTVSKEVFDKRKAQVCHLSMVNCDEMQITNRFECGLFDPGSLHRYDSNIYFLQPACFISMKVKEDSNNSYSFFIPISSDENMIIPDTKWYEAGMIMQNKPLDELLPRLEPQPNNH